jgi:uncharacterized membrane protein YfcA
MIALSLFFGALVGFALGLTGGGGSIFAVPMLVYGLAVAPREAVGVSLAAVGTTALVGALQRLRAGEVELGIGVFFAMAGMAGAPLGSWLNGYLPESVLLVLFAGLMAFVAIRMWQMATKAVPDRLHPPSFEAADHAQSHRRFTPRYAATLALLGLCTGVLSGLFGVGGGFVIVPALVLAGGVAIHRAVATSLVVIALVSAAGVISYLAAGRPLSLMLTALFVLGGVGGMAVGTRLSRRLSGPKLQKGFAVALVSVAAFIMLRNLL